ncbi:hypothetical protein [Microbacterium sp.]|uniref:hypothetical protein n=1 Tax=Microbacterium sp. TaxID=51671 RepID=UPI003C71D10C
MPDSCEALATDAEVSAQTGLPWRIADQDPDADGIPGPLAQSVAAGATEKLECLWFPDPVTEGYIAMRVLRIDAEARDALMDSLADSTEYNAVVVDGEPGFSWTKNGPEYVFGVVYVFIDDLWLVIDALGPAEGYLPLAELAVSRIRV